MKYIINYLLLNKQFIQICIAILIKLLYTISQAIVLFHIAKNIVITDLNCENCIFCNMRITHIE